MKKHFTATIYIFHQGKALLHIHSKLKKWLPAGGHIEANETPPEAARREAKEETGLDIVFIEQENIKLRSNSALSFERPFLCLLEPMPSYKDEEAHQHMDMIYLAHPKQDADLSIVEKHRFCWFSQKDLIPIEQDLFPDTRELLDYLFTNGYGA